MATCWPSIISAVKAILLLELLGRNLGLGLFLQYCQSQRAGQIFLGGMDYFFFHESIQNISSSISTEFIKEKYTVVVFC